MKKILFPTDFSATSLNAFVYALHLAKRIGAEIVALHVYELPVSITDEYYDNLLESQEITELGNFEKYKSQLPKLRNLVEKHQAQHVRLSHILERGNTVDTILELADRENADFIVLGTHGASGIKEGLIGTVAEKVMNRAKCMVLAIPSMSDYAPPSKILFLTQFEKRHKETLHKLIAFANMFDAHIDVLQVKSQHTDDEQETLAEWQAEFSHEDVYFFIIGGDSIEETVMDFMTLHHTKLLAMTVKRKGLFGRLLYYSVASKMVFHSKIPVLSSRYE